MSWLVFLTALLLDQGTKLWAELAHLVTYNRGVSLGLLEQLPSWLITILIVIVMYFLWRFLASEWRRYPAVTGLFWAGAVSNLLDRLMFGRITDWLALPGLEVRNNLADIFLSLGLILLVVKELWRHAHRNNS